MDSIDYFTNRIQLARKLRCTEWRSEVGRWLGIHPNYRPTSDANFNSEIEETETMKLNISSFRQTRSRSTDKAAGSIGNTPSSATSQLAFASQTDDIACTKVRSEIDMNSLNSSSTLLASFKQTGPRAVLAARRLATSRLKTARMAAALAIVTGILVAPSVAMANAWYDWAGLPESVGGDVPRGKQTYDPTCASFHCIARGTDGKLYETKLWGGDWTAWEQIDFDQTSAVSIISRTPGSAEVFVRGDDNALWHSKSSRGLSWSEWKKVGGKLTSAPSCVAQGNDNVCLVRGGDNAMHQIKWSSSSRSWGSWSKVGGYLTSEPSCVVMKANNIHCFVRGKKNVMYQIGYNGSTWGNWIKRGGSLSGAPACTSSAPNTIDCVVRNKTENELYHIYWDGKRWSDFNRLANFTKANTYAPSRLTLTSWGTHRRLDVFHTQAGDRMKGLMFAGREYEPESWMGDLESLVGNKTLGQITIPGSHNAGTFAFVRLAGLGYAKNQGSSIYDQLTAGVRYLDLRFRWLGGTYKVKHGAVTSDTTIDTVLGDVKRFLQLAAAAKEIVILNFRIEKNDDHTWDHVRDEVIAKTFSDMGNIISKDSYSCTPMPTCMTFNQIWVGSGRVLLLDHDGNMQDGDTMWSEASSIKASLWTDTHDEDNHRQKIGSFAKDCAKKPDSSLYLLQAQRTPTASEELVPPTTHYLASYDNPYLHGVVRNDWASYPLNIVQGDYIGSSSSYGLSYPVGQTFPSRVLIEHNFRHSFGSLDSCGIVDL